MLTQACFPIDVDNRASHHQCHFEIASDKNFSTSLTKSAPSRTFRLSFLLLLRTPLGLRSCAWLMIALASFYFFPFHVHPTGSAHSVHHFGVAHQTSLRSLQTMMSSSNSPQL